MKKNITKNLIVERHNKLEEKMRDFYYKPLIDEIWEDIRKIEERKYKNANRKSVFIKRFLK